MYLKGKGEEKKAFALFERASKYDLPDGIMALGACYAQGLGCTANPRTAFLMYEKAAKLGLAEAQYQAALCLESGLGVKKDRDKAVQWLRKAMDKGHAQAKTLFTEIKAAIAAQTKP
jgi:TPR repeat protein